MVPPDATTDVLLSRGAIDRLSATFGHPRRVRILLGLGDGPGSATSLAARLGDDLTGKDLEYHLKVLANLGVIILLERRKVRGARESIFELAQESIPAIDEIPIPILLGVRRALEGDIA